MTWIFAAVIALAALVYSYMKSDDLFDVGMAAIVIGVGAIAGTSFVGQAITAWSSNPWQALAILPWSPVIATSIAAVVAVIASMKL